MCASWSGNSYGVTMRSARGVAFSEAMGTSPLVSAFKNAVREHLHVCVALDAKSCIGCTHANTWSEAGHRLYRITGLCEECWVIHAESPSPEKNERAVYRCDRLKDTAGCEFISKWLVVTHCLKIQQLMEAANCDADYILGVVSGTVELPDVWRPGLRPCA